MEAKKFLEYTLMRFAKIGEPQSGDAVIFGSCAAEKSHSVWAKHSTEEHLKN